MADEEKVVLQIKLDDGSVQETFATLQRQSKRTGDKTEKNLKGAFKNSLKSIFSLKSALAGIGTAIVGGFAFREVLQASAAQQDAVNSLNTSLQLAGRFSGQASKDFQSFASALQETTTVGDEATLELAALASNFAKTNEEAQKMTEAAIELSAATGMELESALKNLGKSTSGALGELAESIPALKSVSAEALASGAAIDFVLERFGGAAASKVNTFSGALKQSSNLFGDLKEVIGDLVTSSPVAIELIKGVSDILKQAINGIKGLKDDNNDPFRNFIISALEAGEIIKVFVIRPIELLSQTIDVVFNGITTAIQGYITLWAGAASKLVSFFAPESELSQTLGSFSESSSEVFDQFSNDLERSVSVLGEETTSESFGNIINSVREMVSGANHELTNFGKTDQGTTVAEEFRFDMEKSFTEVKTAFSSTFGFVSLTGQQMVDRQKQVAADFSKSMKQISKNFATGFSRSFSSIGAALVNGENAFEAFGKSILGVLGGVAIEMGTVYFLSGLASFNPQQTGLGLALITLGGALQAISGGSGGVPNTGGGDVPAGSVGAQPPSTFDNLEQPETDDPDSRTVVNVSFQGNNIQTKDTGRLLKEMLQEEFDTSGGLVVA